MKIFIFGIVLFFSLSGLANTVENILRSNMGLTTGTFKYKSSYSCELEIDNTIGEGRISVAMTVFSFNFMFFPDNFWGVDQATHTLTYSRGEPDTQSFRFDFDDQTQKIKSFQALGSPMGPCILKN